MYCALQIHVVITRKLIVAIAIIAFSVTALTETIFRGGTIITVDDNFSIEEAMAISGNRILAVGDYDMVRQVTSIEANVIDLNGAVILPGFIDAHAHPMLAAVQDAAMDYVGVSRFRTTGEILAHLRKVAKETPAGDWIAARNYDPAVQDGPQAITFEELDAVSDKHPIFIQNASGHIAYANRLAFQIAGIPPDIENPTGSEFVRDEEGRLNGIVKNSLAIMNISSHVPGLNNADGAEALIKMTNTFAANGITTFGDLATGAFTGGPKDLLLMREAAESQRLAARLRAYAIVLGEYERAWDQLEFQPGWGDELVRLIGVKMAADGSNQGRTGLQREPYLGTDNLGLTYSTSQELVQTLLKYGERGFQLAVHGNGDQGIDNILDALEVIGESGVDLKNNRPRIEHCSILHDDQIERMKMLGVSASFLIGHVNYWGADFFDHILGPEKAQLLDRAGSLVRSGIRFSLHSDWTVTEPDILQMIETAVTRSTWKRPDFVLAPEEIISVESAIRAVTADAAWQLHSEHEIGSLEPGKFADLVILGQDPRKVRLDEISEIEVLQTWMNGKPTYLKSKNQQHQYPDLTNVHTNL